MPDEQNITNPFDPRLKQHLPKEGWLSRAEVKSNLQHAFDKKPVVLMTGENGGGKSSTAAEFALQAANSGSLEQNPILYTSFQMCDNLTDLLDSFGQVYEIALLGRQIDWQNLGDHQRLKLVQDVLHRVSLLWVWDDFEVINKRSTRFWLTGDQEKLLELLRSIPPGGGKILILSNSEEQDFLEQIPDGVKVNLGVNPLAHEIARELGISNIYAQTELGDILSMAFSRLSEEDQRILPVLGLFTGVLNLNVLGNMFTEKFKWNLAGQVSTDATRLRQVFDQASQFKLCTAVKSSHYYLLHPAIVAWFKNRIPGEIKQIAPRSFTLSMADFARQSVNQSLAGEKEIVDLLAVEETNLRQAVRYAERFRWRRVLLDLLAGLRLVFLESRRYASWERFLDQVSPHFIHPETHAPVTQKDRLAKQFIAYQVEIALKRERFTQAVNWQALAVIEDRNQAQSVGKSRARNTPLLANRRDLVDSLVQLAAIFRRMGSPKAVEAYMEAFTIAQEIKEPGLSNYIACQIAESYLTIPVIQNFEQAETWIQKSFDVLEADDGLSRSRSTALRGKAAYERFLKAQKSAQPVNEQVDYLNQALDSYFQALELVPPGAFSERGAMNEMIGFLYLQSQGMLETAVEFYDQAITEKEQSGNVGGAAQTRFDLAVALFMINDFKRSHSYGESALKAFETLGAEAVTEAIKIQRFLARFPE